MIGQSPTVGDKLRNARESRGISLQDAARETHIKLHYLQELESDHPELLKSTAQARGFLRLYASYLGLDSRELSEQWEEKAAQPQIDQAASSNEKLTESEKTEQIEEEPDSFEDSEPAEESGVISEKPNQIEKIKNGLKAIGAKITGLFSKQDKHISTQEKPEDLEDKSQTGQIPLLSSGEIFVEIGSTMQQHRERLELSLTDVEHFTNLKRIYLNAIEAGRFNDLPSSVQGRGMLNNYARFLGMEGGAVMDRFAEALLRKRDERLPPSRRFEPAVSVRVNTPVWLRRLLNPDLIVGGILILALFGFIAWGTSRVFFGGDTEPTDSPSISEILQTTPSASPVVNLTLTIEVGGNGIEATAVPGVAVAQPTPTAIATANAAPLQLYIITHDRAYMRIVVDGLEVFDARVIPDEVYTFSGNVRIQLKTGNASALEVYFNQDYLGELGSVGEVVDVDFSLQGLETPTPQPTRTPTPDLREPEEDEAMMMEEG